MIGPTQSLYTLTLSFINSFESVLKQVHSLFQSELSILRYLVPLQSIFNILSFSYGRTVAAYFPLLVFPSLLPFLLSFSPKTCFRKQFPNKMWPIQPSFFLFILWRMLLSSWNLCTHLHFSHDRTHTLQNKK